MCLLRPLAISSGLPFVGDVINAWAVQPTSRQNTIQSEAPRIDVQHMAALIFNDHVDPVWDQREFEGRMLTSRINDGIALLDQNSGPADTISCLCIGNPFSYALLRRPATGGSPMFGYGYTVTEQFAPPAEAILGDAELVMYSKTLSADPTLATLLAICRPILVTRYRPLVESRDWVILKKI